MNIEKAVWVGGGGTKCWRAGQKISQEKLKKSNVIKQKPNYFPEPLITAARATPIKTTKIKFVQNASLHDWLNKKS